MIIKLGFGGDSEKLKVDRNEFSFELWLGTGSVFEGGWGRVGEIRRNLGFRSVYKRRLWVKS